MYTGCYGGGSLSNILLTTWMSDMGVLLLAPVPATCMYVPSAADEVLPHNNIEGGRGGGEVKAL
jgi:hypothetical protein